MIFNIKHIASKISLFSKALVVLCVMCFIACKKDTKEQAKIASAKDIYVAGWQNIGGTNVAMLWKNGVPVNLSDGKNHAAAYSVFVYGTDVYVVGEELKGTNNVAILWKNGDAIALTDGSKNGSAKSLFVTGSGDVYIAGKDGDEARLWRNGMIIPLPFNRDSVGAYSYATGVFVVKGDVYVSGGEGGLTTSRLTRKSTYWKNGVQFLLTTDGRKYSNASCVHGNNSKVLIGGYIDTGATNKEHSLPVYWNEGVLNTTSDRLLYSNVLSIFLDNNDDVYLGGNDGNLGLNVKAVYWKNGKRFELPSQGTQSSVFSTTVLDNVVYNVGYDEIYSKRVAKLWKNDSVITLSDTTTYGTALGIFVK